MKTTPCKACGLRIPRNEKTMCKKCFDFLCAECMHNGKCEDCAYPTTKLTLKQSIRSDLINELLMVFNDYEVPIMMSAEDVRNILINYEKDI